MPPNRQQGDTSPDKARQSTVDVANAHASAPPKRIRLSIACDQCRKRKVKCDTETPKCRNCWLRDEVCETTDPRCPDGGTTVRRWATKDGLLPGRNPKATHRNQDQVPEHSQAPSATNTTSPEQGQGPIHLSSSQSSTNRPSSSLTSTVAGLAELSRQQRETVSTTTPHSLASGHNSTNTAPLSWASRGYQEMNAGAEADDSAQYVDPDCVVNTDISSGRVKVCYHVS